MQNEIQYNDIMPNDIQQFVNRKNDFIKKETKINYTKQNDLQENKIQQNDSCSNNSQNNDIQ